MAIMLPAKPREFDPASKEGLMFEALEQLPDDYYVFHSFQMASVRNNTVYENEIAEMRKEIEKKNRLVACMII